MPSQGEGEAAGLIASACSTLWCEGLARVLERAFWAERPKVDRENYSTAAWLCEPLKAGRPVPGYPEMRVEPAPERFLRQARLEPFTGDLQAAASAVEDALGCLSDPFGQPLGALVRRVHPIASAGPGYDCSHSDPSLPFSVFVSLPIGEPHARLRLAENLLHEAMHLQLTLIEHHFPLTLPSVRTLFSPWQQKHRPLQGVIHGLYVFAAINDWLKPIAYDAGSPEADRQYACRRRREIRAEAIALGSIATDPGLTPFGRSLADRLVTRLGDHPG